MSQEISQIDIGLPLEAKVLSQFFDPDFTPTDYINALISSTVNQTVAKSSITNKTTQLATPASLKLALDRVNALSSHFNAYSTELQRRFDMNYDKLLASSTQIISYNTTDEADPVTRLQYHLTNFNTSLYSLVEDMEQTSEKLAQLKVDEGADTDKSPVQELQRLIAVKRNVKLVQDTFTLLKSLVASTETNTDTHMREVTAVEFKEAINVLTDLMREQFDTECNSNVKSVNEKLLKIVDNMINLQPMFKQLVHFQSPYATFVDFLKVQRARYMEIINS